ERVRSLSGPILLHVKTRKGKGYAPAEKSPEDFHGISKFNVESGEREAGGGFTFSQAFARTLLTAAKRDPKVVAVVAAMTGGTALEEFSQKLPQQFFDVGIAEGHAVTMAGGLAAAGLRPVVAIYSTFLQRAYDQIFHDVCLQNLPVVFAVDRAGLVGEDGPTHHGVFDLAYLRHLPNLRIMAPSNAQELSGMLLAALRSPGPVALRYPRGMAAAQPPVGTPKPIFPGRALLLKPGKDLAILALGPMVAPALEAAAKLRAHKLQVAVVDARSVKPLDEALIRRLAGSTRALLTIEDHVLAGGFGSAVLEFLESAGLLSDVAFARMGLPDCFVEQGTVPQLWKKYGLTAEGIARQCLALLKRKK
ncbi:MAG: 1-deoxy-D-xylulose-5-phosphate synthase, partial [Candidatus Firestonebacteria bacterium]|nr:1-deoxy-D-xylulose-5-phosphate synthase [Candidatus Firestonebacteria bacterium]